MSAQDQPPLPPVPPEDRAWYRRLKALCERAIAERAAAAERESRDADAA